MILGILLDEAACGRLYTTNQFCEFFENKSGLGGKDTIRDRISVLATKVTSSSCAMARRWPSALALPSRLPVCRRHGHAGRS